MEDSNEPNVDPNQEVILTARCDVLTGGDLESVHQDLDKSEGKQKDSNVLEPPAETGYAGSSRSDAEDDHGQSPVWGSPLTSPTPPPVTPPANLSTINGAIEKIGGIIRNFSYDNFDSVDAGGYESDTSRVTSADDVGFQKSSLPKLNETPTKDAVKSPRRRRRGDIPKTPSRLNPDRPLTAPSSSRRDSLARARPKIRRVVLDRDIMELRIRKDAISSSKDDDKGTLIMPVQEIVAIRIDVFFTGNRLTSEGQLLVIPKASGLLKHDQWKSWLWLLLHVSLLVTVTQSFIGPVTTIFIAGGVITMRRQIGAALKESGNSNAATATTSLASICSFLYIICVWLAPILVGSLMSWMLTAAAVVTITDSNARQYLVESLGLDSNWEIPEPQEPKLVVYPQEEISDMLQLREDLIKKEDEFRERFHQLSVGSYVVEFAVSTMLYYELYNSIRLRQVSYYFFNLVMPVLFAFQVFGIMHPYLSRFKLWLVAALQYDVVVRILQFVSAKFSLTIYTPEFMKTLVSYTLSATTEIAATVGAAVQSIEYAKLKFKTLAESTQFLNIFFDLVRAMWGGIVSMLQLVADVIYVFVQQSFVKSKVMPFLSFLTKLDVYSMLVWANPKTWLVFTPIGRAWLLWRLKRLFGFSAGEEPIQPVPEVEDIDEDESGESDGSLPSDDLSASMASIDFESDGENNIEADARQEELR